MTDNLDQDISRGKQAQALLDNPIVAEVFQKLRETYLAEWEITQFRDTDARERLWQAYQIAGKVRSHLNSIASDGKLAQKQLDDLAGKKPKRFGVV